MLFNSFTFLLFFALVLLVYSSPLFWGGKKLFLLLASYIFYAAWNPPFVVLLWVSTLIDWHVAGRLPSARSGAGRKALLLVSLGANLGLLGFFKYGGFLLENFIALMAALGIHYAPAPLSIVLPVGISFYTFQTLSYTIDVYRGELRPWRSFLDFALFVTFFPQLVAGPIVRARDFLPQLLEEKRPTRDQVGWGLTLFTVGLFQKVVLADSWMAPISDGVYAHASQAGFLDAWAGTLAFSAQIFFDFAGYSTCAIGAALCMGFILPDNFRYPYAAVGFSDFWRRWHISLSTWLRDYLYIPLGGNRKGEGRTYGNLMMTMLLGGLWHGASWRFVVWGGLHGTYLAVERAIKGSRGEGRPAPRLATRLSLAALTYLLVLVTWVFFRAGGFQDAWLILQAMANLRPDELGTGVGQMGLVVLVTVGLLAWHWHLRERGFQRVWSDFGRVTQAVLLAVMLLAILMTPGEDRAFIYFQF
jgi:D-alanyl-lipoteichoic acid acyltransferase DltB (MBOAT superfamily)